MVFLGIKNFWPECTPMIISVSIKCGEKDKQISLVPLHSRIEGFKFLISIIMTPFFNFYLFGGISDNVNEFKYSTGITL
jgi:hypothetical protein